MAHDNPFPPPQPTGNRALDIWMRELHVRISKSDALAWDQVNKDGSDVDDLDESDTGTLNAHIAATEVHGATGAVVGADDRPTALLGGSVLLTTAVTDLSASLTNPSVGYVEAEAQTVATQVKDASDKIDELMVALRVAGVLGS